MSFTENLYLKRQIQQLQEENINLKNLINEYSFSTNNIRSRNKPSQNRAIDILPQDRTIDILPQDRTIDMAIDNKRYFNKLNKPSDDSFFSRHINLARKMSSDRASRKSKFLKRLKLPETEGDGPARMEDLYDYLGIKRPDIIS